MDSAGIEKKIAEYEQQAEMMLANFHRLKGAALALRELLKSVPESTEPAPVKEE